MSFLRTAFERASRNTVFRRQIHVSGRSVPLFVTPDAQLKYWKRSFDSDLVALAESFVNDKSVVWDIGANVGVFTFAAAALASKGMVLAVEPDAWLATLLRRSARLRIYRQRDVRVLAAAASSSDSAAEFMIAERGRASNALLASEGRSQMGGVREIQWVPTFRLDTLLAPFSPPDLLKIDVEGAELEVLEGADRILRQYRPTVYVEVDSVTRTRVIDRLSSQGYRLENSSGDTLREADSSDLLFVPTNSRTTSSNSHLQRGR